MKAILCSEPREDLSTTVYTDVPAPEPGPYEIRVRLCAASLNPVDWKLAAAYVPWWQEAHIVGLDGAGIVDGIGKNVTACCVGDRVVWHHDLNRQGVFAEYAVTPEHVISHIPENVSFAAAAAMPCAGYTAYQALIRKARLRGGETLVVQGASGGVGGFALQIARRIGVHTIALARSENNERLKRLGADCVLDYRQPLHLEQILDQTDGGADAMLEVVRPDDPNNSLGYLHFNGQLLCVDELPDVSRIESFAHGVSIHELALGGAYGAKHIPSQKDLATIGDEMLAMAAKGYIDPMIEREIELSQVPEYLQRLRKREFDGKIVVKI